LGNSGVYFITCECFGAKFVKLGRSSDVANRRRELQSGCPFELVIEYVQSLAEKEAIEHERRYRTLFRTMQQRLPEDTLSFSSTDKKRMALPQNLWVDSLVFRGGSLRGAGLRSGLTNKGSRCPSSPPAVGRPLAPLEQGERPTAGSDEGSYPESCSKKCILPAFRVLVVLSQHPPTPAEQDAASNYPESRGKAKGIRL